MANPLLNERDRRGTKLQTTNADLTTVARLTPDKKGAVYSVWIHVVGTRLLTAASATLPAVYSYIRRAVFATSSAGVVTLVGSVQTIGTDVETDSGATIDVATDGTNVDVKVSASYATNWSAHVDTVVMDQVNVG
jgi:hypothetical protein